MMCVLSGGGVTVSLEVDLEGCTGGAYGGTAPPPVSSLRGSASLWQSGAAVLASLGLVAMVWGGGEGTAGSGISQGLRRSIAGGVVHWLL